MGFEWDPDKEETNIAKHRIRFSDAQVVFEDPKHVVFNVTQPQYGEVRMIAVGKLASGWMVAVIFTYRDDRRRIISVRRARRNERAAYDSGTSLT